MNENFPALEAEEEKEQGTSNQNLKRIKTSQLKEKTNNLKRVQKSELKEKNQTLKKVRKPKTKEENQIFKVRKPTFKAEEEIAEAQLSIRSQSTSRSGRVIKTPKKFLSVGEEKEDKGDIQIRLEEVRIKDVRVILPKVPREAFDKLFVQKEKVCSAANLVRKEVEKLSAEKEKKISSVANSLMRELDEVMEAFGDGGHVKMGSKVSENFIEAPLEKGSAVQQLSDSWEDWESMATVESLEGPWRAIESESYGGESFDIQKVDSVLIQSDEETTDLVMSHDGEDSEYLTSESDPSSLLNCVELTLFGEEGELKRSSVRSPGLGR